MGAALGAGVGAGVGANVAKQLLSVYGFVTKPSRQGQVNAWLPITSAQYVLVVSQSCELSTQACLVGE